MQSTSTVDSSRQPIVTYTTARFANEPAKYEQVSGGEVVRGRQIEAGVIALFTVNYRDGYVQTDRITFDGQTYGIHRMHKPDGIKRFLEIHCKAAPV
jgi:SPP1 family predicted phage head-tail adaptor